MVAVHHLKKYAAEGPNIEEIGVLFRIEYLRWHIEGSTR